MSISQEYREELAHVLLECYIDYNDSMKSPCQELQPVQELHFDQAIFLIRNLGDFYSEISAGEIWEALDQLKKEYAQYA